MIASTKVLKELLLQLLRNQIEESFGEVTIWTRFPSLVNLNGPFILKKIFLLRMYSMMSWKHWFSVVLVQIVQIV